MTTLPALKKLKKKLKEVNPFEMDEPTGIVKGVGESLKKDLAGQETMRAMWEQFLTASEKASEHRGGDMKEREEIDLSAHSEKKADHGHIEAGNDYHREIIHYAEREHHRELSEVEQQVQEIVIELQRLIDSSSSIIKAQYQDIAVMQAPAEVGKYHINFFEWMLVVIKTARMKVEDSGAWLATMKGKKGKRDYWSMSKKHGTSFSMSNERQVATQTG